MPADEVVGPDVRRKRSPVARRQIFKELDRGPLGRAQRGDPEPGARDIVQPLLFRPVILAAADDMQAEGVAVEL